MSFVIRLGLQRSLDLSIKPPNVSHLIRNFHFCRFQKPALFFFSVSEAFFCAALIDFNSDKVLSLNQKMDTSNPSVFVNAELLRLYIGRRVRAVIQVLQSEGGAGVIYGKSTDDHQMIVKGSPPFPLSKFVEVIGIADSDKSIRADVWTNFGDTFDASGYNQLCQLANGDFKSLFI